MRELISTPHLAGELEWGQMARKLTPSTRQTPLSRNQQGRPQCQEINNQHGKLEILFLQASFTKRKFKVAMNRRTWTSRAGLMVAWSPPDIQRLLNQLHSGKTKYLKISTFANRAMFSTVWIFVHVYLRVYITYQLSSWSPLSSLASYGRHRLGNHNHGHLVRGNLNLKNISKGSIGDPVYSLLFANFAFFQISFHLSI